MVSLVLRKLFFSVLFINDDLEPYDNHLTKNYVNYANIISDDYASDDCVPNDNPLQNLSIASDMVKENLIFCNGNCSKTIVGKEFHIKERYLKKLNELHEK